MNSESYFMYRAAAELPDRDDEDVPELTPEEMAQVERDRAEEKRVEALWEANGHKCSKGLHEVRLDDALHNYCHECWVAEMQAEYEKELAAGKGNDGAA